MNPRSRVLRAIITPLSVVQHRWARWGIPFSHRLSFKFPITRHFLVFVVLLMLTFSGFTFTPFPTPTSSSSSFPSSSSLKRSRPSLWSEEFELISKAPRLSSLSQGSSFRHDDFSFLCSLMLVLRITLNLLLPWFALFPPRSSPTPNIQLRRPHRRSRDFLGANISPFGRVHFRRVVCGLL